MLPFISGRSVTPFCPPCHDPPNRFSGRFARRVAIGPLAEADQLSRGQVDHAARALGLGRSATYQLIARFKRRPQTSSLLLAKVGRPRSLRLLNPQVEAVIEEAIKTFYLSPQRPRLRALVREIARRCEEQKLPAPTFRTVRGRLAALDPQQVTKARQGARAARQQYEPVGRSPFDELLPLELVQIDHTQLDVIVVDEGRRRTLGRPWLTLAIDVASRVVTGFYVSLDAPAAVSVALVLTQGSIKSCGTLQAGTVGHFGGRKDGCMARKASSRVPLST